MKKKTLNVLIVLAAIVTMATVIDCGGGGGAPPPTTGFKAQGQNVIAAFDGSFQFLSYTTVQGIWQFDNGSAQGNTKNFSFFSQGYSNIADGRVPARWKIFPTGACIRTDVIDRDVTVGSSQLARCLVVVQFFIANPSSVDLSSPPPVVTISGGGLDATYGMPIVEYYDQYSGVLVASATAFSVASDGSSLQVSTPDLSGIYSGSYNIVVSNVASDGSRTVAGVAPIDACCIDPPPYEPPPDPPPCGEGMICMIQ